MNSILTSWLKKVGLPHDATEDQIEVALTGEKPPEPHVIRALIDSRDARFALPAARFLTRQSRSEWESLQIAAFENELEDVRHLIVKECGADLRFIKPLVVRLHDDPELRVRVSAAEILGRLTHPDAFTELVRAFDLEDERDGGHACAKAIEAHFRRSPEWPDTTPRLADQQIQVFQAKLMNLGRRHFPKFLRWVNDNVPKDANAPDLTRFGTDLTTEAQAGRLERTFGLTHVVEAVVSLILGDPPKSVVLLGPAGSGKTAAVSSLVFRLLQSQETSPKTTETDFKDHELLSDDDQNERRIMRALRLSRGQPVWRVLRISPFEMLAGTKYLGEWETRVKELVSAVSKPQQIILYIPNLEQLAYAGRTSSSDMNVAAALAPVIERGDIRILGETTQEAFRLGVGADPSLRRLFHVVEIKESDPETTRTLLTHVCQDQGIDAAPELLDRVIDFADFYLPGSAQPGRAIGLLRRFSDLAASSSTPLNESTLVRSLSTSTGIPEDFLRDDVPLDEDRIRAFFQARVMGQDEAVQSLVDLVTLIKAGLTDPQKPFGVYLFVGPTGVGKTELARSLAELLFGSPSRLLRYDMSEYSTYEAFERFIGRGNTPGILTGAVQNHPFSVILLDEIEKAHANVFDLCLQIFDAGRLTDGSGRTVDLRRTIIIMTSNVGAASAKEAALGFAGEVERTVDQETTFRELGRVFRPEFLNRLDRIVCFRPLTADIAEQIVRRELDRILGRAGIQRRRLLLDIDPSVPALLLKEGYSRAFGARPLKRTVERLLLLPIARAVAKGKVLQGSVIHLTTLARQIHVRITAPERVITEFVPPAGLIDAKRRAETLFDLSDCYLENVVRFRERRSVLVDQCSQSDFWNKTAEARETLDQIKRLEGVIDAAELFRRNAISALERVRLPNPTPRDLARLEELLDSLETGAEHLGYITAVDGVENLRDAVLVFTLRARSGQSLEAVRLLANMYIQFARRRLFEVEVVDDRRLDEPMEDTVTLFVHGAGAFKFLENEAGLHQFTRGSSSKEQRNESKEIVRLEVFAMPPGEELVSESTFKTKITRLKSRHSRIIEPSLEMHLFHETSLIRVVAWSADDKETTLERLKILLYLRLMDFRQDNTSRGSRPVIVRRYVLGPSPLVRDGRVQKRSGHLERVLDGHIEPFLLFTTSAVLNDQDTSAREESAT